MKDQKRAPEDFYDRFDKKLLCDFTTGNPRTEAAILFACEQLVREKKKTILDLGCGIGWSTFELSRALPAATVLGLDLSPRLTQIAQRMFSDAKSTKFLCADLTADAWREDHSNMFDACIMLDVYEHIPKASRYAFHQALSSVLTDEAVVVTTGPTPLHQAFLRDEQPVGLQPIDEDVMVEDLFEFARDLSAEIAHYANRSIWASNDYFFAAFSRNLRREPLDRKPSRSHQLLPKRARTRYLEKLTGLIDRETVTDLRRSKVSGVQRAFDWLSQR